MHLDSDNYHKFPSPEVMAEFPGMTGARYAQVQDRKGVWIPEYQGGAAPEVVEEDIGEHKRAMWGPWKRACDDGTYKIKI